MANVSYGWAGTVVNDASVGTVAWSSPGNAKVSDDSRATAEITGTAQSNYLKATNFTLNRAVPSTAKIIGVEFRVEGGDDDAGTYTQTIDDASIRLVKGGTIQSGLDNKAHATRPYGWSSGTDINAETNVSLYGAPDDDWADATLAPSDIDADFGVAISVIGTGITTNARADSIRMYVYWEDEAECVINALSPLSGKMAPFMFHAEAYSGSVWGSCDPSKVAWKWSIDGPAGWSPPEITDPREAASVNGRIINWSTDLVSPHVAVPMTEAGTYTISADMYISERRLITGADDVANTFEVESDWTNVYTTSSPVWVVESTSNDGQYTVSSVTYNSGTNRTVVSVSESLTDGTNDGTLVRVTAVIPATTDLTVTVNADTRAEYTVGSGGDYASLGSANTGIAAISKFGVRITVLDSNTITESGNVTFDGYTELVIAREGGGTRPLITSSAANISIASNSGTDIWVEGLGFDDSGSGSIFNCFAGSDNTRLSLVDFEADTNGSVMEINSGTGPSDQTAMILGDVQSYRRYVYFGGKSHSFLAGVYGAVNANSTGEGFARFENNTHNGPANGVGGSLLWCHGDSTNLVNRAFNRMGWAFSTAYQCRATKTPVLVAHAADGTYHELMPGIRIDGCEWGAGGQLQGNADAPFIVNSLVKADTQMWDATRSALRVNYYMCTHTSGGLSFFNVAGNSPQVTTWDSQLIDWEFAGCLFAADSWASLLIISNRDVNNPALARGLRGFRYNGATQTRIDDADIDTDDAVGTRPDYIESSGLGIGNVETSIVLADIVAADDWTLPSAKQSAVTVVPPHEVPGVYWDFRGLERNESAAAWIMGAVGLETPEPTVTTPTDTDITQTSATLGGNVAYEGGSAVTERGVVISATATNASPEIGGTGVTKISTAGTTGVFTVSATGLTAGTGYSYRAYATNSEGTGYSAIDTFPTTPDPAEYIEFDRTVTRATTGFSHAIDLAQLGALAKGAFFAACDTADGTKGRVTLSDGTTRVPADWIGYDKDAQTGIVRFKWPTALSVSDVQTVRVYPPRDANTATAASDTYGSDNAYDADFLAYLPMDDGAGTTAGDRTSNANSGTFGGSPSWTTGKLGGGLDFSGSGQYLDLGPSLFASSTLTVGMWASFDVVNALQGLFCVRTNNDDSMELQTWIINNSLWGGNYTNMAISANDVISTAGWYYVVITSGGGVTTLYVDGVASGSTGTTNFTVFTPNAYFGSRTGSTNFFNGQLDEAQIHSVARSADWIAEEYAQTNDNPEFWGAATVEALPAPTITNTTPTNGATITTAQTTLLLDFDQEMGFGTVSGSITGGGTPTTLDVDDFTINISNKDQITLTWDASGGSGTQTITIAAGSFASLSTGIPSPEIVIPLNIVIGSVVTSRSLSRLTSGYSTDIMGSKSGYR